MLFQPQVFEQSLFLFGARMARREGGEHKKRAFWLSEMRKKRRSGPGGARNIPKKESREQVITHAWSRVADGKVFCRRGNISICSSIRFDRQNKLNNFIG